MKQAFTLIELLVIIAIISILAAIAIPAITQGIRGQQIQETPSEYHSR